MMKNRKYGRDLRLSLSGDVAEILFSTPDGLNGYTRENLVEFDRAIRSASESSASVIVLRAEGDNFCIGASADLLVHMRELPLIAREEFILKGQSLIRALCESSKVVVAYIDGFVAGGGFDLMLACDVVFVGPHAKMNLFYPRLALLPDHGALFFLEQKFGPGGALAALRENRTFRGEACVEAGLANKLLDARPDADWIDHVERATGLPLRTLAALKSLRHNDNFDRLQRHLAEVARVQAGLISDPLVVERVDRIHALQKSNRAEKLVLPS